MAKRGKSFSVDTGSLDKVLGDIKKERDRANAIAFKKVKKATDIVYAVAHAKRPMITNAQAKAEGRRKIKGSRGKYQRVSDPNAEAGVPVQEGALQASLQKEVQTKTNSFIGRIWTQSPYAAFLEWGTSRMQARPFLRPAIALTRQALKDLFEVQIDP